MKRKDATPAEPGTTAREAINPSAEPADTGTPAPETRKRLPVSRVTRSRR